MISCWNVLCVCVVRWLWALCVYTYSWLISVRHISRESSAQHHIYIFRCVLRMLKPTTHKHVCRCAYLLCLSYVYVVWCGFYRTIRKIYQLQQQSNAHCRISEWSRRSTEIRYTSQWLMFLRYNKNRFVANAQHIATNNQTYRHIAQEHKRVTSNSISWLTRKFLKWKWFGVVRV